MNRSIRLVTAAALLLFFMGPVVAALERFPAGVRIAVSAKPVVQFGIEAVGPSVIWISAEANHLRTLTISTPEATAAAVAVNGRASCFLPVYASGSVEVRIETAGGDEPVVVTSTYGIGEVVRNPIVTNPPPPPITTVDSPAVLEPSPAPVEPPVASAEVVSAPVALPPVEEPPPLMPVEPPPPEPISFPSSWRMIFVGEEAGGTLGEGANEGFRFYVPNRLGFTVTIDGACQARLFSDASGADRTDFSGATPKRMTVSLPSEGHYRLILRGTGAYRVIVEVAR